LAGLITQRSQVQILSPLLKPEARISKEIRASGVCASAATEDTAAGDTTKGPAAVSRRALREATT
ncbi:hypothetical protein ABZ665_23965, partial [Streptomyces sp. NPDC007049]|uniref:hypothetical protein n=1 Tax=Streptomyces sp. NPDC007049 TaxID=3156912 RepID=UPI0033D18D0E